ncbi:hypothetical protein ACWCQS_24810 [Streptomyces sp. NPDC002076]
MGVDRGDKALLDRLTLLADAQAALASTLDVLEGLRRACRVLTGRLWDWCTVDLLDEGGRLERAVVVHRTPEALGPGGYEGPLPPVPEGDGGPLPQVLRGRGPCCSPTSFRPAGRRTRCTPGSWSCSSSWVRAVLSSSRCGPAARSSAP